jgi:hypothetical protein
LSKITKSYQIWFWDTRTSKFINFPHEKKISCLKELQQMGGFDGRLTQALRCGW